MKKYNTYISIDNFSYIDIISKIEEHWQQCGGQVISTDYYLDVYLGDDTIVLEFKLTFPYGGVYFNESKSD